MNLRVYIILILFVMSGTMSEKTISVLTFNIWDLFVAPARQSRMDSILEELKHPTLGGAIRKHDILTFQEMWSWRTYWQFKEGLDGDFPFSHYYERGTIGSGLAIFSKYPIVKVSFHPFTLNGHPSKVFDGDWFAQKGVAHARIQHHFGLVDVFTTHLIADYSNDGPGLVDEYQAHRIAQAHEMMQFVRVNKHSKGIGCFLMGDFNFGMDRKPWVALIANDPLMKSIYSSSDYSSTTNQQKIPCTANCPTNGYTKRGSKPLTIDHILFTKDTVELERKDLAFTRDLRTNDGLWELTDGSERIWHRTFTNDRQEILPKAYSDHYGISAVFKIKDDKKLKSVAKGPLLFSRKDVWNIIELLQDEKIRSTNQISFSLSSLIVLSTIFVTLLLTICYLMANPIRNPLWVFYGALTLLPLLCWSIAFNGLMCWIHYPAERAALEQFATELQYYVNSGGFNY